MADTPGDFDWRPEEGRLAATGAWDINAAAGLDRKLNELRPGDGLEAMSLDLSGVTRLDTGGAWLLERQRRRLAAAGVAVDFAGVDERHRDLLTAMERVPEEADGAAEERRGMVAIVERVGRVTVNAGRDAVNLV